MSRINTNVQSIIASRVLTTQNSRLNSTLERLSTGLRINSGKDDPAGLIASESMRAEMSAIQAAQTNVSRAMNVVGVAESGLNEINSLLNDLEDLVDRSANESGISDEEAEANQQEIDQILQSINRISNSTELQGRRLLAGELDYTTSGVSSDNIAHMQINSARVPTGGSRAIAIDVTTAASQGVLKQAGGVGVSAVTIEVTGNLGSERLTFVCAGSADIVAAINDVKDMTGVEATLSSDGNAYLQSAAYGSDQFVRVTVLEQATSNGWDAGATGTDYGTDIVATANGQSFTGKGLNLNIRTSTFDATIELNASWMGTAVADNDTTFDITGGGATFAISPQLDMNGLASIGLSQLNTTSLGTQRGGFLYQLGSGEDYSLANNDYTSAQRIVRTAISQVANLRGRLGSFQKNVLETNANSLQIQYENVASAESTLRDADFAQETADLTRSQILVQSATNVLRIANAQPQNILSLLG